MGLSEDGDDVLQQDYDELCLDLNMDSASKADAWEAFQRIRLNYTLEVDLQSIIAIFTLPDHPIYLYQIAL